MERHKQILKSVPSSDTAETIANLYSKVSRPGIGEKLASLSLDLTYHRAHQDHLYAHRDGAEVKVLDLLGGYGSCFFGHHYKPFVDLQKSYLDSGVPFMAQGSCRKNTALLAKKLDEMLHSRTDDHYISLVLSTGAEAVEASMKYAEYHRASRLQKQLKTNSEKMIRLRTKCRDQDIPLSKGLEDYLAAHSAFDCDLDGAFQYVEGHHKRLLSSRPSYVAIKRAYHGKTSGAIQITDNRDYRAPFDQLGPESIFIDADKPEELWEAINSTVINIPSLRIVDGQIALEFIEFVNISGLFLEPLQGEGGIHPLSKEFVLACKYAATQHDFLLIFDEIQSGMGRTGSFLYSDRFGIYADIYLLSKSLGGGLSKISTVSIVDNKYEPSFDAIHSSTFAEDDYSAGIALKALELLDGNSSFYVDANDKGRYIQSELSRLALRFPGTISEVRGAGLLIGIEWEDQQNSGSFLFRALSDKKLFCQLIAGYLLNCENIRIGTTLSSPFTLRIQPSVHISKEDCDRVVQAVGRVAEAIYKMDAGFLVRYLTGNKDRVSIRDFRSSFASISANTPASKASVTFIATPAKATDFSNGDRSLESFTTSELTELYRKTQNVIGPVTVQNTVISTNNGAVDFRLVVLPYLPMQVKESLVSGDPEEINNHIRESLNEAVGRDDGCFGLGSYTSIIAKNGLALTADEISITTGNSLTVGMSLKATLLEAEKSGIDRAEASAAILGATGNIGSVFAELMADEVSQIVLIGTEQGASRLKRLAYTILENAYQQIISHTVPNSHCVAKGLINTNTLKNIVTSHSADNIGQALLVGLQEELGDLAPIVIESNKPDLSANGIIVTCTNAATPILFPEMLGQGAKVICDISVPNDVDESVAMLPNVTVIQGGLVKLPYNECTTWEGIPSLPAGVAYACMAETMLLGLTGQREHFSYGRISKNQVTSIMHMADQYGFRLASAKTNKVF